jgi:flavodoxin
VPNSAGFIRCYDEVRDCPALMWQKAGWNASDVVEFGGISAGGIHHIRRGTLHMLIAYYSYTGNNEFLARELQKRLDCDVYQIVELKNRSNFTILWDLLFRRRTKIQKPDISLDQYDRIILMAPIWDSKLATPMKTFMEMERDHIHEYAFLTVCTGREGQGQKLHDELTRLAHKEPLTVSQLKINNLLPPEKQNKVKHTSSYRITQQDFPTFEQEIADFIKIVT